MTNAFLNSLTNLTYTQNGAVTNKSTNDPVLDFFYLAPALRTSNKLDQIVDLFKSAYAHDPILAMKAAFYIRDIRAGGRTGERSAFRLILQWLAVNDTNVCISIIPIVAEFGRWDDLFVLFDTPAELSMLSYIRYQLNKDVACLK